MNHAVPRALIPSTTAAFFFPADSFPKILPIVLLSDMAVNKPHGLSKGEEKVSEIHIFDSYTINIYVSLSLTILQNDSLAKFIESADCHEYEDYYKKNPAI